MNKGHKYHWCSWFFNRLQSTLSESVWIPEPCLLKHCLFVVFLLLLFSLSSPPFSHPGGQSVVQPDQYLETEAVQFSDDIVEKQSREGYYQMPNLSLTHPVCRTIYIPRFTFKQNGSIISWWFVLARCGLRLCAHMYSLCMFVYDIVCIQMDAGVLYKQTDWFTVRLSYICTVECVCWGLALV